MHPRLDSPRTAVVVTGGASGIGLASARALAAVGRPVAIWDLDARKSGALAAELAREHGVAGVGIGVDLRDPEALGPALEATRAALPAIGGLVHAAGVVATVPVEELTAANWDAVLDVNLRALALLVRALLPDLRASRGSAVVGIASINATLGNARVPAYSASKGGMLSLVRSLADGLAAHGVRINAVSPGQIRTPMLQTSLDALPPGTYERRILLGRLGEAAEVGRVVRFLLSDEASYITAAEVVVDGGNLSSQR
jgi:NAD(P)-dependent dehydrogenase (short-subunit alcohol dehydrogenase family)